MTPREEKARGRFCELPRPGYQTIYAVQLTNGWVKVGCSKSLRSRFAVLANEMRRKHGADIADIHFGEHIEGFRHHIFAEHTLLRRMHAIHPPIGNTVEFFDGVDFGHAARLVDEISKNALRAAV